MLIDLLDDIKFHILCYLDVHSLLNLSATCRQFQTLVAEKTVWLDALENIRSRRPVSLAHWEQSSRSASASLPLERLKTAVVRAAKLEYNWSKPIIRPTRFTREAFPFGENGDHLQWVWNLGFCGILFVYTVTNCCTLIFNATGQSVTFQTGAEASCFDFDVDSQGITLIFNVGDEGVMTTMEVHRVEFADSAHRLVKEISTQALRVDSNFLEDELAGCILTSSPPTYQMIVTSWRTGKFAKIDTGIEVRHRLTASTTKNRVLLAYEGPQVMLTWWYDLDSLRRCIAQAKSPEDPYITMLSPQRSHQIHYIDQGLQQRYELVDFYPTSRGMWTGRQCFLTVYQWSGMASFTYALIPEDSIGPGSLLEAEGTGPVQVQDSLEMGDAEKQKIISRKSFVYHLPEDAMLSTGLGFHYLHDFGYQGKHAVWVEEFTDGQGGGVTTCRLATFNHKEDTLDMTVSDETSTIIFENGDFSWNDIRKLQLDDQSGVLVCFTQNEIWKLYFD